jgi:hypothetical protein
MQKIESPRRGGPPSAGLGTGRLLDVAQKVPGSACPPDGPVSGPACTTPSSRAFLDPGFQGRVERCRAARRSRALVAFRQLQDLRGRAKPHELCRPGARRGDDRVGS